MIRIVICLLIASCVSGFPNNPKIVNGTDAELGEFPYMVSLRTSNLKHNCGGAILNENFVITAAHCVRGFVGLSIQYGVVDISADEIHSIPVAAVKIHEGYMALLGYRNDVAVLKLASPIPLSQTAKPVTLPHQEQEFEDWPIAVLIGWGLSYTGGEVMEHLQKVDIRLYPAEECVKAHGWLFGSAVHVCAGVPEGGKGQCSGDSGGPLTVDGVLVGTVSWSVKPCTKEGYPGVFAKVAHYVDWIKTQMETM